MDTDSDVMLHLAAPRVLQEDLLDHLLAQPQWVQGFTVTAAEGHGADVRLESALEQIRGRASRCLVSLALQGRHVDALLDSLRAAFGTPQISYWVTPLLRFGRLK